MSLNDTLTPQLSLFVLQLSLAPEEAKLDRGEVILEPESPSEELVSCCSYWVFKK